MKRATNTSQTCLLICELLGVQNRFRTLVLDCADEAGLSLLQAKVLFSVEASHKPRTVSEIAKLVRRPRQVVGHVVWCLVDRGLLEARENPRRFGSWLFCPTEAGAAIHQLAEDRMRAVVNEISSKFASEDRRALRDKMIEFNGIVDEVYGQGGAKIGGVEMHSVGGVMLNVVSYT